MHAKDPTRAHLLRQNTNFASAASQQAFADFAKQGQLLDQYYAVTHPSEPNYMA